MEMLEVTSRAGSIPDSLVVSLKGPLVVYDLFALQNLLREDLTATTIVDMSQVPYIDSAGVGMLINAFVSREKSGRTFALVGVGNRPMAVFKVTHVDSIFPRFSSVEEAERALGNGTVSGAASA